MQKMRAAGVNVFPAEDSFKYVNILDKVKQVYLMLHLRLSSAPVMLLIYFLKVLPSKG